MHHPEELHATEPKRSSKKKKKARGCDAAVDRCSVKRRARNFNRERGVMTWEAGWICNCNCADLFRYPFSHSSPPPFFFQFVVARFLYRLRLFPTFLRINSRRSFSIVWRESGVQKF